MDISFVPYDLPPPPKKYNFKKKKSQYGQRKKHSSSAVSHHQGVEHHHPLDSGLLSDSLFPNECPSQTPNKHPADDNWRITRAFISQDKIIQDENLKRISVEENIVQEIAKGVDAEDKARDANERRNHYEHDTRRDKHAPNIFIHNEKKESHDLMKNAQFMMKESHEKRRSHQRGVDLLMFVHKNERQLEKMIIKRWSVISRPSTHRRI